MGKRLPKKELLNEIQLQRDQWIAQLDGIPIRKFNLPGINEAGWSIKDVMTHILDWEIRTVQWCESGLAGESVQLPAEGYRWNQIRELNAAIQKRHSRKSIKRVRRELEEAHETTLASWPTRLA